MLLNEFLDNSVNLAPEKVALIEGCRGYTFKQIDLASDNLAHALTRHGFLPHDRGIIFLNNSIEAVISIFAILKCGGVFVVVSPSSKIKKLKYIVEDCQATVLITDTGKLNTIFDNPALSVIPQSVIVVEVSADDSVKTITNENVLSYSDLIGKRASAPVTSRCIDVDLASLIYTSGSSGNPKGVMLTHKNMVSATKSIVEYLHIKSDDVIIDTLPLAFDYGLYQILMAMYVGASVVIEQSFTYPRLIIERIINEKVTFWPMVPTMIAILIRLKGLNKYDLTSIRCITSTGQVLPEAHIEKLVQLFPAVRIFSMYGLTECKRVLFLEPDKLLRKPGSVGKPMPNVDVFLVDNEGHEINEPRKPGELVVRGSNVMPGYWNLPVETNRVLRQGTYPGELALYTGDIFETDEEGDLYFIARKDDIIKTAGYMVSPKEVEQALTDIDGVVEASVLGIEDDILGKSIKAFVHVAEGFELTVEDVIAFCSDRLEHYAVPKEIVFCDKLPETDTGKIKKTALLGGTS